MANVAQSTAAVVHGPYTHADSLVLAVTANQVACFPMPGATSTELGAPAMKAQGMLGGIDDVLHIMVFEAAAYGWRVKHFYGLVYGAMRVRLLLARQAGCSGRCR